MILSQIIGGCDKRYGAGFFHSPGSLSLFIDSLYLDKIISEFDINS